MKDGRHRQNRRFSESGISVRILGLRQWDIFEQNQYQTDPNLSEFIN